MIITGGKFRGQKILTTKNNDVRPTSSKVRESLFNMLFSVDHEKKVFLDLFSGSGIMGIEALSRGFENSIFIEKNPSTAKLIEQNLKKLKIDSKPIISDSIKYLDRTNEQFDIIFADPPYAKTKLFDDVISKVYEKKLLSQKGILIVERPTSLELEIDGKFNIIKDKTYGTTNILFLRLI